MATWPNQKTVMNTIDALDGRATFDDIAAHSGLNKRQITNALKSLCRFRISIVRGSLSGWQYVGTDKASNPTVYYTAKGRPAD